MGALRDNRGAAASIVVLGFLVIVAVAMHGAMVDLARVSWESSVALREVSTALRCEEDGAAYLSGTGETFEIFGRPRDCLGPPSDFRGGEFEPLWCVAERLAGDSVEAECDSHSSIGHR